jgi:hypothetical protein
MPLQHVLLETLDVFAKQSNVFIDSPGNVRSGTVFAVKE